MLLFSPLVMMEIFSTPLALAFAIVFRSPASFISSVRLHRFTVMQYNKETSLISKKHHMESFETKCLHSAALARFPIGFP